MHNFHNFCDFGHLYFQQEQVFTCKICKVMKSTEAEIEKHMTAHNRGLLCCRVCKKAMKIPTILQNIKTHTSSIVKKSYTHAQRYFPTTKSAGVNTVYVEVYVTT